MNLRILIPTLYLVTGMVVGYGLHTQTQSNTQLMGYSVETNHLTYQRYVSTTNPIVMQMVTTNVEACLKHRLVFGDGVKPQFTLISTEPLKIPRLDSSWTCYTQYTAFTWIESVKP